MASIRSCSPSSSYCSRIAKIKSFSSRHRQSSVAATISAISATAPPTVARTFSAVPRALVRRTRRARRRTRTGGGDDDEGFLGRDGDDGPFGGGGDGGKGWGFGSGGGGGWRDWEGESESRPRKRASSDLAIDFIYEVICWIALSNCTHFAFTRVCRMIAAARPKAVPLAFVSPVC